MKETSFTSDCDYLAVVLKYEWIDDENEIEEKGWESREKDYSKKNRMKSELCWFDNIEMIWVLLYWNDAIDVITWW